MMIILLLALNAWLIWYLLKGDHGEKELRRNLLIAGAFGLLALLIASFTSGLLPTSWVGDDSDKAPDAVGLMLMALAALIVGVCEEGAKFIPAAIWLRKKVFFNEMTDGFIYFGIVAVVFGAVEDLLYGLEFGEGTILLRLVTGPFMHVAFTMIPAAAFARYRVFNKGFSLVIAGFITASLLHAAFDFGLFSKSPLLSLVSFAIGVIVNILIFTRYRKMQKIDGIRESRLAVTGDKVANQDAQQ